MNREDKQLSGGARLNKEKTVCKRGHPFDQENTFRTVDGRRNCLTCKRENGRRNYRYRKKVSERTMLEVRRELAMLKRWVEDLARGR